MANHLPYGRPKGTKNKLNLLAKERMESLGHDPIIALCRLAMQAEANGEYQLAIMANGRLAKYSDPELRSVEHRTEQTTTLQIVTGIPAESGDKRIPAVAQGLMDRLVKAIDEMPDDD